MVYACRSPQFSEFVSMTEGATTDRHPSPHAPRRETWFLWHWQANRIVTEFCLPPLFQDTSTLFCVFASFHSSLWDFISVHILAVCARNQDKTVTEKKKNPPNDKMLFPHSVSPLFFRRDIANCNGIEKRTYYPTPKQVISILFIHILCCRHNDISFN